MKFEKEHRPARTIYRIDRILRSGEVYEYYGSEVYDSRQQAKKAATKRFNKYIDEIKIVAVHEKASDILASKWT